MKKVSFLVVAIVTVFGIIACGEGTPKGELVAKVGSTGITKAEFDSMVDKSLSRYKSLGRVNQPAIEMRIKQNVLRRMIDNKIFNIKAKEMGVTVSDEEVNAKLEEHKKRFGGDKAFQEYLERTKNNVEDLKDDIRSNILREEIVKKVGSSEEITDEDVKKHYEENTSRYIEPEKVKASHILIKLNKNKFLDPEKMKSMKPEQRQKAEKDALEKAKKEAMKKASKVLKLAKKKGADFAELAKKYSEGPTAPKGGDLGFFTKNRMVKPFSDAAFAMKAGDVSDIVETRFGLHIIKVIEKEKEVQKSFDEVKDSIKRSLESRNLNQNRREVLKKLKDEIKVEILAKFDAPQGMNKPQFSRKNPGQLKNEALKKFRDKKLHPKANIKPDSIKRAEPTKNIDQKETKK